MSQSHDDDNSGTLGRNKLKQNEKHPDHTGSCVVDGKPYWISAWIKTNKSTGEKFFSFKFKPKEPREDPAPPKRQEQRPPQKQAPAAPREERKPDPDLDENGDPDNLPF